MQPNKTQLDCELTSKAKALEEFAVRISVVIAWVNSYELLDAGLRGLIKGTRRADEIIVVTRHGATEQQKLRDDYPEVTLIGEPANTPITRLRSIGVKSSSGSVIVVTEDHCVPSENWLLTVEKGMLQGFDVVGGPVENAWGIRMRDWAAFLTEYAFAIRGSSEKEKQSDLGPIPGNNAAYKRELADGLCRTLDAGLWESFYYDELRAQGKRLVNDSDMLLYHRRPFDFVYFIGQRFHFCRSFAEMRSHRLSRIGRIKYGIGSVILPPLLWIRGLQTLIRKQRMIGRYFVCSPLVAIYLVAGASGEMYGYLFGGGNSLARVE